MQGTVNEETCKYFHYKEAKTEQLYGVETGLGWGGLRVTGLAGVAFLEREVGWMMWAVYGRVWKESLLGRGTANTEPQSGTSLEVRTWVERRG